MIVKMEVSRVQMYLKVELMMGENSNGKKETPNQSQTHENGDPNTHL